MSRPAVFATLRWLGFSGILALIFLIWNMSAGVTEVKGRVDGHEHRIQNLETTGGTVVEKHVEVDRELKREATERFQRIEAQMKDIPEMKSDIKLILQRLDSSR